ncbi:hypothetical protein A1Q2_00191 [Trichosporon asahii var. asahii CBS 8904]|uniref:Uncharacterized protein n=1 Tax=Trichosporon asahii var. asahii (strain CBS 8904) TaxID=1220162 RepID=K1VMK9_TRIAC|nr:hypothetical protein A1Q2_00191 [Trichosporon asahii var. asahii CBS 8904]
MRPVHLDPAGLRLAPYRGGLAVLGPALDAALPGSRPPHPLHITLLTPAEAKTHPAPTPSLEHIYVLDIVTRGQVTFAIVVWVHGNTARKSLGLLAKDFHVTLSATDAHDIPKGISQLPLDVDGIADLGLDALDHVFLAAPSWQTAIAERMVIDYPASFKGYRRLAAVSSPKLACMALARAAIFNPALRLRVVKELRRRNTVTSYVPMLSKDELATNSAALLPYLSHPWPDLGTGFWPHPAKSDSRPTFRDHVLPDGFSFIYPRICISSAPQSIADVHALEALGATHVLTLTAESWLPAEWFDNSGLETAYIENVHVPIPHRQVPTLSEMDAIFANVNKGGTWLVHGADTNDGRAGTVLACLVAMFGEDGQAEETPKLDALVALRLLREARPHSVLSEKQERFVAEWIAHCWSLHRLPEPTTPLEVTGDISPRVLILIGRHGAGKTWFANALAKRSPGSVMVVGEDYGESRSSRLREFSSYAGNNLASFVVLDRCNLTEAERAPWFAACNGAVAVWFDYEEELCRQRIEKRIDDPRTRFLRGLEGQQEAESEVEPPTPVEFAGVLRIASFAAAREALERLAPVPAIDFPPTPQLDLKHIDSDPSLRADPRGTLVVEEKLQGTELRISLDVHGRLRAHRMGFAQNDLVGGWMAQEGALRRVLERDDHFPERFTLFGVLTSDAGAFFATNLYDRAATGGPGFVSRDVLERLLCGEIPAAPVIMRCAALIKGEILEMSGGRNAAGSGRREGVVVRWEARGYCFKTIAIVKR